MSVILDGTFKCLPNLIAQFYTIHGQYGGFVVPLVYAFLPNKQAVTYRILFERLLVYLAVLRLRPCVTEIVTDCEAAVVSVVREMLLAVTHRLCFFHFCQANYRYVTENCGLAI